MTEYDPMSYGRSTEDEYERSRSSRRGAGVSGRSTRGGRPKSNFGWATCALLFFWPLSFSAFSRAGEVAPLWHEGRYDASHRASRTAKVLGQISLGLFFLFIALWIGLMVILSAFAATAVDDAKKDFMDNLGVPTSMFEETTTSTPTTTMPTTSIHPSTRPRATRHATPTYPVPAPAPR